MAEQIYYEDVTEGMTIPALEKVVTSRSLVMYSRRLRGLCGDTPR